jgi:BirA family transcriptional regulator, biotin operon repressor / biotin---[acetyl-CoA-carboxylase] ligase
MSAEKNLNIDAGAFDNSVLAGLLRLLADGEYHSGEELGAILGVSRAAVWKRLKK